MSRGSDTGAAMQARRPLGYCLQTAGSGVQSRPRFLARDGEEWCPAERVWEWSSGNAAL